MSGRYSKLMLGVAAFRYLFCNKIHISMGNRQEKHMCTAGQSVQTLTDHVQNKENRLTRLRNLPFQGCLFMKTMADR